MKRIIAAMFLALMAQAVVMPDAEAQVIFYGRICCTNAGSCVLQQWRQVGSRCACYGTWGTDWGQMCQ